MNYQEKQNLKLERYQELAEKNKQQGEATLNQVRAEREVIPLGQPILIGHHSERGHRNHLERLHNREGKGYEQLEKAEHYEKKAENILNPNGISSDNPEAINLLKAKLEGLEKKRELMKEVNKQYEKTKTLEGIEAPEVILQEARHNLKVWTGVYAKPFPAYVFTNLSGNIRTAKQRVEQLGQIQKIPDQDKTINGILIKTDKEENRIKLFFPSIPSEAVRTRLKQNGFKWSPFNKCWQRQLNNASIYLAEEIAGGEVA